MDYKIILDEIKPTEEEKDKVRDVSGHLLDFLNDKCYVSGIDAEAVLVGSVAKKTYLRGKSDIDIFISFPLSTDKKDLKQMGLDLAHQCCDAFNAEPYHQFASHPYVTTEIDGFKIDFVPCYQIDDGSQLKSAVDRTILHTKFVQANLKEGQNEEVLLLKRFMDMTGTYGSEFKVGGFAGYLCELLIIKYGTFENTLKEAADWQFGHTIDLMEYGTAKMFKDPLICIDPTDKNRNVGAALRLDKYSQFIQSARNYLNSDKKYEYFYPLNKYLDKDSILNEFKARESNMIAIKFDIPQIPLDTLHPQLKKTADSLKRQLDKNDFLVFQHDYWTDEESCAVILLELAVSKLNNIKVHEGPRVYYRQACDNFIEKFSLENCYLLDDMLVYNAKREFTTPESFISNLLTKEHISIIKVGKNLTEPILDSYNIIDIEDLANDDFLIFLDDFLYPNQHIKR
ncbi:MAG: CCA tRNA nucleotidyltransferase [Methanobrevibacter sp.]|uniref:CCA tRNA nucleotidyltransferase n=1 Tax=Methanobrevibacter sp. TaxID=66852 RepID=UPI001B11AEF7|nr:CCA tRNA nucleotidyltransferase [Methanobrevibacter sp.]MBO5152667.1 CCA tRNA nucleotidyltransferase [Methanobrevibacter sp.]